MELHNQLRSSQSLAAPVHPPERVTGPPELHHSEGRYQGLFQESLLTLFAVQHWAQEQASYLTERSVTSLGLELGAVGAAHLHVKIEHVKIIRPAEDKVMTNKKRILVIEPHSDDGIIGCGGYLNKYREENEYYFILVAASDFPLGHNQNQTREGRLQEFKDYVNYYEGSWVRPEVEGISLPIDADGDLDTFPRKTLVKYIERSISLVEPHTVICTGPSFHHDHTAVYEALIAATRPTTPFYPMRILISENPTYVHTDSKAILFRPDTYVSLSEDQLSEKIEAFSKIFPSQIRPSGNCLSSEGIRSWARYRGIEARCRYAEAFQTFSLII